MLLQRKNDSRDASSTSLSRYGVPGLTSSRVELEAEQEVGADQNALQRRFDSAVERAARCARVVERHQGLHIVDRRPAGGRRDVPGGSGSCRHRREPWPRRAEPLPPRRCRPAAEDAAAARCFAEADADERSLHRDALDAGIAVEGISSVPKPQPVRGGWATSSGSHGWLTNEMPTTCVPALAAKRSSRPSSA